MRTRGLRWLGYRLLARWCFAALPLGTVVVAGDARADEEVKAPMMQEPGDVVDVIDAFDDDNGDPFDVQVSLGFTYLSKRARILRESSLFAPGPGGGGLTTGGFTAKTMNVGRYIETTSKLTPQLDLGIYKDLALYLRIPIILVNSRKINSTNDSASAVAEVLRAGPGEPTLFDLPFKSPNRSGVEYVAVGLNWGIFNQARDQTKPTWVIGGEGRISAGKPMRACTENPRAGQVKCAHEGDINRNGSRDGASSAGSNAPSDLLESNEVSGDEKKGVATGYAGLELHTLMSKRLKYIEPYGGFSALVQVKQGTSGFEQTSLDGALVNHPPHVGTVLVGMMIHPWENREAFGRFTIDLRFQGEYHSEGRDYSELFDALGSSDVPSVRNPRWERYTRNNACDPNADPNCPSSVVDETSKKSYFTGLSVVEPYGSYRAAGSLTWRAAEFVKIQAGLGLRFDQAHGISHDQPCNPDFDNDPYAAGPCHSETGAVPPPPTGIPNPAYRPTINAVGRRFYVDESITYEVFASGIVMF